MFAESQHVGLSGSVPSTGDRPRSLAEDGSRERLGGWDSHAPLFWVLENPQACFLVPQEETVHISEAAWLATARYSDICDYVMQVGMTSMVGTARWQVWWAW